MLNQGERKLEGEWKKKNEHLGAKNTFISESVQDVKSDVSPCCCTCDDLQTAWVPDELVQNADNLLKLGSVVSVLLPAIEHQLIQRSWAVHGRGQPVVLLNGIDDL